MYVISVILRSQHEFNAATEDNVSPIVDVNNTNNATKDREEDAEVQTETKFHAIPQDTLRLKYTSKLCLVRMLSFPSDTAQGRRRESRPYTRVVGLHRRQSL